MTAGNNSSNQAFDTLLRLLPSIIAAYPAFISLFNQQGSEKINLTQLVTALPQILDEIRDAEPEQLERLVDSITEVFPGLEAVLSRRGGERHG